VNMEKTQIPLAVVALDLKTGVEVVLREGSLQKAVGASCAIPGILPPVRMGELLLVDGGWINRVPVGPLRKMGADFAIAVDVAEGVNESMDFETGLDIVLRTNDITQHSLSQMQLKEADIIIRPDLAGIRWSDFHRLEDCLKAGEDAAKEKMDEIRSLIRKKKMKKASPSGGPSLLPDPSRMNSIISFLVQSQDSAKRLDVFLSRRSRLFPVAGQAAHRNGKSPYRGEKSEGRAKAPGKRGGDPHPSRAAKDGGGSGGHSP